MRHLGVRAALLAAVVAIASVTALAQSGRHPPTRRPEPAPTPAPAETPAPAPAPAPEEHGPKIPISAAKYMESINVPDAVGNWVLQACLDHLRTAGTVSVLSGKDMNRKQATDLAKTGPDTFVLLLQFSIDAADEDRSAMGPPDLRNLVVTYTLFAPTTGKVKTQGRLYFTADRATAGSGRVLVPYSGVGRGPRGYTPDQAGEKVAEAVLSTLSLPTGTAPPPRF
jgi:hypothetical protein